MCETTLNYNHVQSVLGRNGRIFFPSQLLPMIIGLCGLVRILYICFERWRSPDDIKPSLADRPVTPTRAATVPRAKSWLRAFAPRSNASNTAPVTREAFEGSDLDVDMIGQPAWWRYLVAWLPWLQAASYWFKEEKSEHAEKVKGAAQKDDLESGWSAKANSPQRREFRSSQGSNSDDTLYDGKTSEDHSAG
jgi:hypothetical protein